MFKAISEFQLSPWWQLFTLSICKYSWNQSSSVNNYNNYNKKKWLNNNNDNKLKKRLIVNKNN